MSLEEDLDTPPLGVYHTTGVVSGRWRDLAHRGFGEKNACFAALVKVQLVGSGAASH
jgi:hypothetical protein